MGCGRCRGLMVVDHFIDMQDDSMSYAHRVILALFLIGGTL
jgi:hypothetical protein